MRTPHPSADRNLLFGLLALQMNFVTPRQLLDGMHAWMARKHDPLGRVLQDGAGLGEAEREAVERLLELHVARHGGSERESLAAVAVPDQVRRGLGQVADPDVQESVGWIAPPVRSDGWPETGAGEPTAKELPSVGPGRYQKVREHARGGLGEVFIASDGELKREVALKEIRAQHADRPEFRARFVREAMVTGSLEHPGVVPVYGLGSYADGRPYYAMRFVRGESLQEAIARYHQPERQQGVSPGERELELRSLLTRFVAVCNAVGYAHSRGVIHRDLKPANVMLGEYGETYVVDWGLAKPIDLAEGQTEAARPVPGSGDSTPTALGQAVGTPGYMAPEQARGEKAVGPASDVFGLGAVLYCVLTGRAPYRGDLDEALAQAARGEPPRVRGVNRNAPWALDAVCAKAMASAPDGRYATARDLAAELERWLADEPVTAYREPLRERARRWAGRHRPLVAAALTAAGVMALTATALGARYARDREEARGRVEERLRAGLAAARSGELDRATHSLGEAAGLCQQHPALASWQSEIDAHLDHINRFREFRGRAVAALRAGVHGVREKQAADALLRQCEEALALYEVTTRDDWQEALHGAILSEGQVAEVRRLAHELLMLAAVRLALFDRTGQAGQEATRRGLGLLDQASRLEKPSTGAWVLRMFWNRRLGNNTAADEAGRRSVEAAKAGRQSARDHYLLGSIFLQVLKRPKEAVVSYQRALKEEPNHYGAHFGLFLCYSSLKDDKAQVPHLTACLALRPEVVDLYYFRGMAHFALRQHAAAFDDFDAAVARDPRYATGYFYRGRMHVVSEKWAEAEKDFTKAVGLKPDFTQALQWRAVARAKTGRHREAAEDAAEAARRQPDDPTALFFAARAYAQAAGAVREDAAAADREALAKSYGDRSVELLGRAIARGFKELRRVGAGSDFDPVRGREDFKAMTRGGGQ